MAVLNIKARKKLQDMELVIDITEIGFDKITYKPLSKQVIDEYKKMQGEQQEQLTKQMMSMLKLDKKMLKGDLQTAFLGQFDVEKLAELSQEAAKEFNIVCRFLHTIEGVPTKEELLQACEAEVGEDLAMEAYLSLANIVFTEFQEALAEMEKIVTPS